MKTIITTCFILLSLTNIGFACSKCTETKKCEHKVAAIIASEHCGCKECEKNTNA